MNEEATRTQIATTLKAWIVGVGIVVTSAFIVGCWSISQQVTALATEFKAYVVSNNQRVERLERIDDNHYRGGGRE